jgi:hypothetical protein
MRSAHFLSFADVAGHHHPSRYHVDEPAFGRFREKSVVARDLVGEITKRARNTSPAAL